MEDRYRLQARWALRVIVTAVAVYMTGLHLGEIVNLIKKLIDVSMPVIAGIIIAVFLNVPVDFIEKRFLEKHNTGKSKRPLAIILALVLVFGVMAGVAFLVVPELIEAVKLLAQIASDSLSEMAQLEETAAITGTNNILSSIDWLELKSTVEAWFNTQSKSFMTLAAGMAEKVVSAVATGIIGLALAIYMLAQKEKLINQICYMLRVWLPRQLSEAIIHIAGVCNNNLKLFVTGQVMEAIILGSLCAAGMLILRLPYAPMIGALVGVMALIPIVGAWVGAIVGIIMIMTVNPFKAFVFLIFLLILQQVEGNIIYPRVVGSKTNLPALWVLTAITIGGNIAGPLGMLLAVPAASAIRILLKEATEKKARKKQARQNNH